LWNINLFKDIFIFLYWYKRKYPWDPDSAEEIEEHVRDHSVRIINDEFDSDSNVKWFIHIDSENKFNY